MKKICKLTALLGMINLTYAQVGINTTVPQSTFDVVGNGASTTLKDGIIAPRLSRQQLAAKNAGTYAGTQVGAIVYVTDATVPTGTIPSVAQTLNITTTGYYFFDGTAWKNVNDGALNIYNSNGSLTGNRVVTQGANTLAFTPTVANGFSIDGTTFSVDGANHRVGVGTSAPGNTFHTVSTAGSAVGFSYNLMDAPIVSGSDDSILRLRNTSVLTVGNIAALGFSNNGPTSGGPSWELGSVRTRATSVGGDDFFISVSTGGGQLPRVRINANSGNVGIGTGTADPTEKLQVVGNILASGTITPSDIRIKKDIVDNGYGLNEILKLRTINYRYKDERLSKDKKIGFVAQEVKAAMPELVTTANDEMKTLGVNYAEMTVVLTKAMQEQQKMIKDQQGQIDELKAQIQKMQTKH